MNGMPMQEIEPGSEGVSSFQSMKYTTAAVGAQLMHTPPAVDAALRFRANRPKEPRRNPYRIPGAPSLAVTDRMAHALRRRKSSDSSITLIPRASAFSSFDPALAPAITKSVLLLTLLDVFPPACLIRFEASVRDRVGSVPVKTKTSPAIGESSEIGRASCRERAECSA